jgi:hypothetical protein
MTPFVRFTDHRLPPAPNKGAARRLGWTPAMPITWREFLDQYPYQARALIAAARGFGAAA